MNESEYRAQLDVIEDRLTAVYRERRRLQEAFADEHPPVLPAPRFRTDHQARIARCPRCGSRLDGPSEIDGAKK